MIKRHEPRFNQSAKRLYFNNAYVSLDGISLTHRLGEWTKTWDFANNIDQD